MKFDLIYADPPWDFRSNSEQNVGRNVRGHYNTLDLKRLKSFPVESIAEEDSMIAMWTTGPMLDQAISLMRAWGFKFKGSLFTWIKTTKKGTLHVGLGYITRKNAEYCLYGTKGKGLGIPTNRTIEDVIMARRMEHSKKPIEAYERLEILYPKATRVELFARNTRNHWISFGNEVPEGYATAKRTFRGIRNMKMNRSYFEVSVPQVDGFY